MKWKKCGKFRRRNIWRRYGGGVVAFQEAFLSTAAWPATTTMAGGRLGLAVFSEANIFIWELTVRFSFSLSIFTFSLFEAPRGNATWVLNVNRYKLITTWISPSVLFPVCQLTWHHRSYLSQTDQFFIVLSLLFF